MTLRQPEYIEIKFYKQSTLRFYLTLILSCLIPLLFPLLLWYPALFTRLARKQITTPSQADFVLVKHHRTWEEIKVHKRTVSVKLIHSFQYRKLNYVLIGEIFECITYNLSHMTLLEIHLYLIGLSSEEAKHRLSVYGPNIIDVEYVPVMNLILRKLFHPFYLFQIGSVTIWYANGYPLYATIITFMSIMSATYEIYTEKRNEYNLRQLVHLDNQVTVIRDGEPMLIDTFELVVGDAVRITCHMQLVCDFLLLQGQCVVDESSISGESAPIVKSSLPSTKTHYQQELFKSNTLFSGSTVTFLKEGEQPIAVVMSSGFDCTKGDLFRAIIYPEEIDFKFNRQSYNFLVFMTGVAFLAFTFKMITGFQNGESWQTVILGSLDMFTITVPPALPLVLSLGVGFSMKRLKEMGIFCINSERINLAGWIDLVCWDKTGTLTDDKLEFQGFDEVCKGSFNGFTFNLDESRHMLKLMAICHSVHVIDGVMVGHFVDKEMFRATYYNLLSFTGSLDYGDNEINIIARIACPQKSKEYLIVKRFDFDAHRQLASVIYCSSSSSSSSSSDAQSQFSICVKGSPEAIQKACKPESIPADYRDTYKRYSGQGYYVIAFAERRLSTSFVLSETSLSDLTRTSVETELVFCGFAMFRSPIRPESYDTIKQLEAASIRSTIITGDNGLTAINVARQLNMGKRFLFINKHEDSNVVTFSEIPYTDEEWSITYLERPLELLPSVMKKFPDGDYCIAVNCIALNYILDTYEDTFINWFMESAMIFSRAKPRDKTRIIQKLIQMGHYTMMTGDGTNDCGALKAAHVGVALSDTEASIVAPFSSRTKSVADIPKILAEGRCALVTSFTAFQYMAVYPVVQLLSSCVAVYFHTQMADGQYLFDDIGIVFGLATFMLYTKPRKVLSNETPVKSLFSVVVLTSFIGQILINITFSAISLVYMRHQYWYCDSRSAQSRLSRDYLPIDPTLPYNVNYPCYFIDPVQDANYETLISTYETTFPWLFSHFQYIISAIVLCLSTRFRRAIWTNFYFTFWIALTSILCVVLMLIGYKDTWFEHLRWAFQLRDTGKVPSSFRYHLLMLVLLNLLICVFWEKVVVGNISKRTVLKEKLKKMELIKDIPNIMKPKRVEIVSMPIKVQKKS